jgi:hypothetical protein
MGRGFRELTTPIAVRRAAVWLFVSVILLNALELEGKAALLVIDVQNDFLPGGSLPVKQEGNLKVERIINKMLIFKDPLFDYVVASQDWHPKVSTILIGTMGLLVHVIITSSFGRRGSSSPRSSFYCISS